MGKVEMMLLQLNDDLLRTKVSQQVLLHLRHEQHRMKAAESGKKKKKKIWYRKVPVALASGAFNCTMPQPYNIYIYARLFCSAGARVQHPVVLNVDGIFK